MSMQEVREQNIALVTQTALACFVENGIEKTTIRDIALGLPVLCGQG